MFRNPKQMGWWIVIALTISLLCSVNALAKKPPKPDDPPDDDAPKYAVIELTGMYSPRDISNPLNGDVWVAGNSSEGKYTAAAYGHVNAPGLAVAGYLPEPRTPLREGPWNALYGDVFNRASTAEAVNDYGVIVGGVDLFDPDAEHREYSAYRAAIWLNTESGYVLHQTLGVLPGHTHSGATGVTNDELIVGESLFLDPDNVLPREYRAFIWDAIGGMRDLNVLYPNDDWVLERANGISETGWVVGEGTFGGVMRAFRLDLATGQIDAVPLPSNGVEWNRAWAVNAQGHVVGQARTNLLRDTGSYISHAFYWDGESEHAVDLGSLTDDYSNAYGVNAMNEIVGASNVDVMETVATYWAPDGAIVSLETEVPSKPKWRFTFGGDVNNDGWIVAQGGRPYRNTTIWTAVVLTPVAGE
jgi:hypothetical protein